MPTCKMFLHHFYVTLGWENNFQPGCLSCHWSTWSCSTCEFPFCWKSVHRPQLSSWVQCHLHSCQWCPVETYCRHTGACIGFGRTFWNEAFKYIIVVIIMVFLALKVWLNLCHLCHLCQRYLIVQNWIYATLCQAIFGIYAGINWSIPKIIDLLSLKL